MASGHEIQCSKVPHAPNNAKQNRSGSESEKQNTEAEFAEGAILRPHKLEATSCEQHSFFKIDGLTPCNAQVHWLVNRLDGPTSRKELILISDLVGRSKEGVVIEIVDMAFNDGTCHTDGSDVPWQNMVQIKPCCLQDLLDGDCVHFPIGRKLLENLDSTVFVRHEPSPHIPFEIQGTVALRYPQHEQQKTAKSSLVGTVPGASPKKQSKSSQKQSGRHRTWSFPCTSCSASGKRTWGPAQNARH
mmetsp:Transcript_1941/g.4742  ORF Transcript_1941/g.4742 Transcript_1941/m.4742 type:complete len:245 (-) Transcript_1941:541-1275(-)